MKLNRITASFIPTLLILSAAPMLSYAQSYEVQELPSNTLSKNQFANSIDETGLMLSLVTSRYNQPVDLSLIDLASFNLTDLAAAQQGNFNAADLATVTTAIYANTTSAKPVGQKLSATSGYSTDGTDINYVFGLDSETQATNGYTYSLATKLGNSVNGTHIVGTMTGPYRQVEYTNEAGENITYVVSDYKNRGFVQIANDVKSLLSQDTTLGGVSEANAINVNYQVAGTSSIAVTEAVDTAIAACADDEIRSDIPIEACHYAILNATSTDRFEGALAKSYITQITQRATVWQLDSQGNTLSQEVYGLTFTPEDDSIVFSTEAFEINDAGQAVGYTLVADNESFSQAAAVFENGETKRIVADDEQLPNFATAINNDGIVTGYITKRINRINRSKFFVYNNNTDSLEFPDDFFISSSSTPRAINNNGLIVGDAEIDPDSRRRNGFIYDINANTFVNLNTLTACDSSYDIIAANDINDSNEIIAEALVKRPARDSKGNVLLDSDSQEILTDVIITIKLNPTGADAQVCEPTEQDLSDIERQGAGMGILTLIGLCFIGIHRRFKALNIV